MHKNGQRAPALNTTNLKLPSDSSVFMLVKEVQEEECQIPDPGVDSVNLQSGARSDFKSPHSVPMQVRILTVI